MLSGISLLNSSLYAAGDTIAEVLRRSIRLDIVRGRLPPGAALRTQTLCDVYGCSLAPLREALFGLAADGLVIAESQRGFRVASTSRAEWCDLIQRRLEIEPQALSLAIKAGDDRWEGEVARREHEFRLISQRHSDSEGEIDELWEQRHRALLSALLSGCGSPWLLRFCEQLHDHCDRYRRLACPRASTLDGLDVGEHDLVAAALKRDVRGAKQIIREHIHQIRDAVLANSTAWDKVVPVNTRGRRRTILHPPET